MLLVPVQTGNLHFIDHELKNTLQQIISTKVSAVEFRFFNQPIQKSFPEMDDHYYDKVLNLRTSNFKITVTPHVPIEHWRLGLKFGVSESFPERTQRHGPGFPIFHLEKNTRQPILKVSAYDADNKQIFTRETTMREYYAQTLLIFVALRANITTVDVQSDDGKSILNKPFTVEGYAFAKLLAWGDNRNQFEIKTVIEENRVSTNGIEV